ncbi:MAG: SufE family protein [Longimonas sp.]|uniref:SufE family protein n=1 Tax=Longimonas sp. TaxID=2039626 RepID=UPI00335BC04A
MSSFQDIAAGFQMVDRDTRLDLLLEYAGKLPPLPEAYQELRDAGMNMVHECQSPVFLRPEVRDGTVRVIAHVPRNAPTARAFVSILHEAFDGATPEDVANATDYPLRDLGLSELLGAQRTQGLSAIYQRMKHAVAERTHSPIKADNEDPASAS